MNEASSVSLDSLRRTLEPSQGFQEHAWSTLAHDLRNLLMGVERILGVAAHESGNLTKRTGQLLLEAQDNCGFMIEMLGDVLDIRQMESRQAFSRRSEVNLISVIEKCVKLLRYMAEEKDVNFRVAVPRDIPQVLLDERRLIRVLINLLHNALKFSPPQTIVDIDVQVAEGERLVFAITDQGNGMHVQRARQEAPADLRQYCQTQSDGGEGFGIGLCYCTTAVPALGGEIWVESPPQGCDSGSRFHFTLPLFLKDDA